MERKKFLSLGFGLATLMSGLVSPAQAAEPAYCQPDVFLAKEVSLQNPALLRFRTFQVGAVRLSGLSIGMSIPSEQMAYAEGFSPKVKTKKYCTWYLNRRNYLARASFVWHDLRKPDADIAATLADFSAKLRSSFSASEKESLVSCLLEDHFLSMGCDGQMHRGPSVFAMVLAYSGCSAANAVAIANLLWGENGVPTETRVALAEMAQQWAAEEPASSQAVRQAFSQE